jgi:hypothetical protein
MPTKISNFRLGPEVLARIDQVAEASGGLTRTRVIELAVDKLHREICGYRHPRDWSSRRRTSRKPAP